MRVPALRPWLLRAHRVAGLTLAGFLIIAGLTGSVAAFHQSLDAWLNPDLFRTRIEGPGLSPARLIAALQTQMPQAELRSMLYRPEPGWTVHAYLRRHADPTRLAPDELFLEPTTGALLGSRRSDASCCSRRSIIPFLYRFHHTLGLGRTGEWIMGIAAMLWVVDCIVGLLLTFPPHGSLLRREGLARWRRAWRLGAVRSAIRLTFDLHRAASLWLWVVLLGMAISGVALALDKPVFRPVVRWLLPTTPADRQDRSAGPRMLDIDAAERIAAEAASKAGWHEPPGALFLPPGGHTDIFYFYRSSADRGAGLGNPIVAVDDRSGRIVRLELPGLTKADFARPGDLVLRLQLPWHSGQIAGLAGRILVAITGVAVAMLAITGTMIWQRKRRARRLASRSRRAPPAARRLRPVPASPSPVPRPGPMQRCPARRDP